MKILSHPFFRNKFSVIVFLISLTLNLALWLILYFKIRPSDYPIPLHYSIYFGIDTIDYWYKVFIIPGIGVMLLMLNLILCIMFYKKEKFIAYFLGVNNFCLQAILLGAGIPVVLLQGTL